MYLLGTIFIVSGIAAALLGTASAEPASGLTCSVSSGRAVGLIGRPRDPPAG